MRGASVEGLGPEDRRGGEFSTGGTCGATMCRTKPSKASAGTKQPPYLIPSENSNCKYFN